jgi:hypothetical protein
MITKKEQSYSDSSSCLGDHLHFIEALIDTPEMTRR